MKKLDRRGFVSSAALLSGLPLFLTSEKSTGEAASQSSIDRGAGLLPTDSPSTTTAAKAPKSLIHSTDLFRPHDDPDDHWDLVTGYALAWLGELDLLGVLIDNPENVEEVPELIDSWNKNNGGKHVVRSPDVAAVAQLNYITDRAVPVTAGPVWPGRPGEKVRAGNFPKDLRGVNMLLDTLKQSSQPVAILIGGSCQNVAIAGVKEPHLFAEKCSGIYVNVGAGSQNPKEQSSDGNVEWNVSLNRGAYATMFELPCPIYWMPCFHGFTGSGVINGEYGTAWSFRQKEVLPYLSSRMQAFFAYVLSKESGTNWLSYLLDPASKDVAKKFFEEERGMYCTAGFLHAAGKTVTSQGKIVSLEAVGDDALYDFIPIDVRCSEAGITEWRQAGAQTNRYIFRVRDKGKYATAMVAALKSLLLRLS